MKHVVILTGMLFAGAYAGSAAPQSGLTPSEQSMAAFVDTETNAAVAMLERAVNINSGSLNFDGVRQVGALFRAEFDALGFKTEWIDGAKWNRAGHLVATKPGPSQKILLIGHLDTVFERDSPFQRFERIDANHAKGPGICDMKGGNVIMLVALKALRAAGLLDRMNVTVVLTGDEESTGRPLALAREALVNAARGAAVAIGFENGDGDPAHAVVARRGTTSWRLETTGTTGHSSQIFSKELGYGAAYEAARILNAFREQLAGEQFLTFNPGVITGGADASFDAAQSTATASGKTNIIAARTIVVGDLRALSAAQFDRARQTMTAIVAQSLPGTKATITFDEGYPPLAPAPGNEKLLGMFDRASRDLGFGPVTAVSPDRAGAADVSFVAGHVPMIIDAVGMKGRDDHSPSETADLRSLAVQAKRVAVLFSRLAAAGKEAQ